MELFILCAMLTYLQTGWSPSEGHPYHSMAIIILLSDIRHLINTQ